MVKIASRGLSLAWTLRSVSVYILLIISVVGLSVAISSGRSIWMRATLIEERLAAAIENKQESTADPHKGLSAYLFSGLDNESRPAETDGNVFAVLTEISQLAQNWSQQDSEHGKAVRNLQATPLVDELGLRVTAGDRDDEDEPIESASEKLMPDSEKIVLATKEQDVFLWVPARILARPTVGGPALELGDKQALIEALTYNPEVLFDIFAAKEIAKRLKGLDGEEGPLRIDSRPISQAYFLTESGVMALRASGVENQKKHYETQFSPHRDFTQRPYFWGAVALSYKGNRWDYQTEPYMDLGGNGIVVTHAKTIELPGQRYGVVCVDVRLDPAVEIVKRRLRTLGGDSDEFTWVTEKGMVGEVPENFEWFSNALRGATKRRQSRILGSIATEADYSTPRDNVMRFTVPLRSSETPEGRETRLLWCEIDFDAYAKRRLSLALWFLFGVVMVLFPVTMIVDGYAFFREELEKLVTNLSRVMAKAKTPFAWVDERGHVKAANEKFLRMLRCKGIWELNAGGRSFSDLLTSKSQSKYKQMVEKSALGQDTEEYRIVFRTKNDAEYVKALVHGERIPFPAVWKRNKVERFGVVLSFDRAKGVGDESELDAWID